LSIPALLVDIPDSLDRIIANVTRRAEAGRSRPSRLSRLSLAAHRAPARAAIRVAARA
jgi:hypothetical protein